MSEQDLSLLITLTLTKVRQLEILNGKRFRLIVITGRLTPSSMIAGVTVPYLIPFIVKIPSFLEVFFFSKARSYPDRGRFRRSGPFPFSMKAIIFSEGEEPIK